MELSGKVVLVAGGGGGIGLGIAKGLANEGGKVALTDISEEALAKAASDAQPDVSFLWRTCDITSDHIGCSQYTGNLHHDALYDVERIR